MNIHAGGRYGVESKEPGDWPGSLRLLRVTGGSARWYCEGIDLLVDGLGTAHPRLGVNAANPVGEGWDMTKIFFYMLFGNDAHGNGAAGRDGDDGAKELLHEEDAERVMNKDAMAEISAAGFRLVHKAVKADEVMRCAALFFHGRESMVVWVRHDEIS